jgi:hypothetical protein
VSKEFLNAAVLLENSFIKEEIGDESSVCKVQRGKNNNTMLHFTIKLKNFNPESCMDACSKRYYIYEGLQNRNECFCGNQQPSERSIVDPSDCNKACFGNKT